MTKQEQKAMNDRAYSIFNSAMEEWHKDGESKRVRLYHCQAEVIWTIHYEILCSYNTIIACIEKSSGTLVDVLRTEYGYTNTSAQHIRKFSRQYFGDHYYPKTLVSRPYNLTKRGLKSRADSGIKFLPESAEDFTSRNSLKTGRKKKGKNTMKIEKMTVREFLNLSEDMDVYDNYTEELGIAFCGPMYLTEEGENEFSEILDFEVEIIRDYHYGDVAIINVLSNRKKETEKNLKLAIKFFHSLAGYCAEDDYEKWFIEGE